jgi:hypothetical protein
MINALTWSAVSAFSGDTADPRDKGQESSEDLMAKIASWRFLSNLGFQPPLPWANPPFPPYTRGAGGIGGACGTPPVGI